MPRTRIHLDDELLTGRPLSLQGDRARYLGRVLRLRTGDALTVFNGSAGEFEATVAAIGKQTVQLDIGAAIDPQTESPLDIQLVQGISRGERMDIVVQKATELGVRRISPVITEYSVVKLNAERAAKRRRHWQKIAVGACEQCGRIQVPEIDVPVPLDAWFGQKTATHGSELILQPGASRTISQAAIQDARACLLIGPEGGFSDKEYENAAVAGFTAVSLGPRILRTETAAMAALTVAQSLWGDLR